MLSFLNNRSYTSTLPKAYLNWVLLDNQFKYVASNIGAMQVQAGSSKQALVAPLQTIAKNGYLYVYVSNQSPQDVYFDDLIVTHTTGPLLQEQSYYPFGLQMAGISDKAMLKLDSKNKFNGGVELEEDYGVNLYSTFYRQYDPQIGRFGGVDILSEKMGGMSVYQFGANNPVIFNDPNGAANKIPSLATVASRLLNSAFGGTFSYSDPEHLFLFGSEATEQIAADFGPTFGIMLGQAWAFADKEEGNSTNRSFGFDIAQAKSGNYYALISYIRNDREGNDNTTANSFKLGQVGYQFSGMSFSWGED